MQKKRANFLGIISHHSATFSIRASINHKNQHKKYIKKRTRINAHPLPHFMTRASLSATGGFSAVFPTAVIGSAIIGSFLCFTPFFFFYGWLYFLSGLFFGNTLASPASTIPSVNGRPVLRRFSCIYGCHLVFIRLACTDIGWPALVLHLRHTLFVADFHITLIEFMTITVLTIPLVLSGMIMMTRMASIIYLIMMRLAKIEMLNIMVNVIYTEQPIVTSCINRTIKIFDTQELTILSS